MMGQTADRFEIFQVVFSFLNLLVFLPSCLILPQLARPWKRGPVRTFWLALIPFSVAACFALVGERDPYGVAHITLLSLLVIGLGFLAANFTARRVVSLVIVSRDYSVVNYLTHGHSANVKIVEFFVRPGPMSCSSRDPKNSAASLRASRRNGVDTSMTAFTR